MKIFNIRPPPRWPSITEAPIQVNSRREGFYRPGLCADRRLDVPRYGLVTASVIPAVGWAWRRQSIWSQTADKLKVGPHRLRGLGLGLTVGAAALALAGSQVKTLDPVGHLQRG
jgi:hypothetical protein